MVLLNNHPDRFVNWKLGDVSVFGTSPNLFK
nr:MAG TPA: hypothetical protein [Caudoviricetes sp.]